MKIFFSLLAVFVAGCSTTETIAVKSSNSFPPISSDEVHFRQTITNGIFVAHIYSGASTIACRFYDTPHRREVIALRDLKAKAASLGANAFTITSAEDDSSYAISADAYFIP
jgi:hypothetical protein